MDQRFETGWLFDFYGPLLTERQQDIMMLRYEDDMSLSEIAGEMGISRQAVSEAIHHAEMRLSAYEEKLGLLSRYQRLTHGLQKCLKLLDEDLPETKEQVHREIRALLSEEEK